MFFSYLRGQIWGFLPIVFAVGLPVVAHAHHCPRVSPPPATYLIPETPILPIPTLAVLWDAELNGFEVNDQPRGTSSISFKVVDNTQIYAGTINPGDAAVGFASYRFQKADNNDWDLSQATEVVISLIGDGNTYRFLLRDTTAVLATTDYSFQAEFATQKNIAQEIHLKISDFKPYFHEIQMPDDVTIDLSQVAQWGIQASSKTTTDFKLVTTAIAIQ